MFRLLMLVLLACTLGCDKKDAPSAPPETPPSSPPPLAAAPDAGPSLNDKAQAKATKDGELGAGTDEQQALLVRAKTAFLEERWPEATTEFKKLTQTGPLSGPQVTAYIALAQIYQDQDQKEDAMKLYVELLEKAPEVAEVQFVVARAFAEEGETTRAIKAYELTLKYQPDYLQAYVELAGLLAKAGRAEESARLFLQYEERVYKMAKVLEDKDADVGEQVAVLDVFSFIQDDRANQAIANALDSPHPEVRERAVLLASEFGLGAVVEKVQRMANNDPDLRVRLMSKQALTALNKAPSDNVAPTFVDKEEKLPNP